MSRSGPRSFAMPASRRSRRKRMDQNLKTDAVTSTKTLCGHLAAAQATDLTPAALREARRGVLDWIGCALAGSGHKTISTLLEVLSEPSGRPQASVFGRKLKLGLLDAPLANGQMGHVLDYDDTHMGGVVLHTSSPVLAALFALAERSPVSGLDFMLAYAVGFEAGVRSGRTAPGHHKGGWHLTGTLGSIDAGVALRNRDKIDPATVSEIGLRVHPLVLSITGVVEPSTGLQSKFSTLHSAAVALIDGTAGIAQYSDAKASDPAVAALRRKVKPVADDTLRKDEAHATIVAGNQRHDIHVAHASGTADNPMSDAALEAKFLANAAPVIGSER